MIDDEFKQIPDLPEGQMTIEPHLLRRTVGQACDDKVVVALGLRR